MQINAGKQNKGQDSDGCEGREKPTGWVGPGKTMGHGVQAPCPGRSVLAGAGARTSTSLGCRRLQRYAQNSCRATCSGSYARGLASYPSGCGERCNTGSHFHESFNEGTKGRQKEAPNLRKRRTGKIQGSKRRPSKRERKRRGKRSAKAEMFWLEQWEWALRFFSAWTGLRLENPEGASMYDLQLSWPSQQVMPTKERGRMMAGDSAQGGDEGIPKEPPSKKRRKGDVSSSSEDTDQPEDDEGGDAGEEESDPLRASSLEEYFKKREFVFVHHYAGANDPLTAAVKEDAAAKGIRMKCIGVEKATGTGNLLADEPYATHMRWAERGYIDAFHAGFPCSTFSKLRFREAEGLPGPVRTMQEPYGRAANTPQEQRECDEGTVMASRSINIAKVIAERKGEAKIGAVATLENPPPSSQENHLSAWELPEMGAFLALDNINFALFNTCGYEPDVPMGKRHFKPQQFAGTLLGLKSMDKSCMCTGGHEAVVGRERSRASAEYPKALCVHYAKLLTTHLMLMGKEEYLAYRMKRLNETLPAGPKVTDPKGKPNEAELAEAVPKDAPQDQASSTGASSSWQGGFGKYGMLKPSKAAASRDPGDEVYVGGMRNPHQAVAARPTSQAVGLRIRAAWEALVRKMPQATRVAENYGTADCAYDEMWPSGKGNREYKSPLDAAILEAWAQKSGDPETEVQKWVREGAPLGIEKPIGTCGIFPKNHSDTTGESKGPEELGDALAQMGEISNYKSVTDDIANARIELERYESLGYVTRVSSREVDDTMTRKTVSRLGLIVKEKPSGEIKRRIIIDLRRSGGNDKSSLPEKLVLPRPRDAIEMMRNVFDQRQPYGAGSNYGRELVVIDISDAFMTLGVHPDEHPHTLSPSLEEGTYYMFIALLFGYKTAPLLWSRVAAQWARLAQSFFSGHEAQHQVYLDDALWMLQGEVSERHSHLALVLNTAAALGFKVALAKGERGPHVQWIGVRFALVEESIILTVPERYVRDLVDKLKAWENKGMAPIKELRQVAGKASWMSGLLPRTRWTVSVLYRVLHSRLDDIQSGAEDRRRVNRADARSKEHLFPVKQVEQPRQWLISYLEEALCRPSRKLRLDLGKYPKASIITDASPEGLGAILTINNRGIVETLAVLVALRLWEKELQSCQVQLVVESDSLIALATSQRLAGSDPALNFLGAEISIACEGAGIENLVARHIPGTANVSADYLSRPSKWATAPKPPDLKDVPFTAVPAREASFYRLPTPKQNPGLWMSNVAASNAWASLRS
eukprot:s143_g6.t2